MSYHEPNDCHGDEDDLAAMRRRPERDADRDMEDERDFYAELEKDLSAQQRAEIALSACPEQFRKMLGEL